MKNMRVYVKLIVSFTSVVFIAIAVGGVGMLGMYSINSADDRLYEENVIAFEALGDIRATYLSISIQLRDYILFDYGSNEYNESVRAIESYKESMQGHIQKYESTIGEADGVDEKNFGEFKGAYSEFLTLVSDVDRAAATGKTVEAVNLVRNSGAVITERINNVLLDCVKHNDNIAGSAVNNNRALFNRMMVIQASLLAAGIIYVLFMVKYLSNLISKPLGMMAAALEQIGSTGDLELTPEMAQSAAECAAWNEEIGKCARAVGGLIGHLKGIEVNLGRISEGDLTVSVNSLSDRDNIGIAVSKLVGNLNSMFGDIMVSTTQVSEGTRQVADGSQSLALGSTEQASAVEQLSSSIAEIAEKTKTNAEMAEKAATLAGTIMSDAERGSHQMDEMVSAVREINQASQSISKVIKVIDDIAFQTNILALNAAVEAARAGQHGKGFAVVAEEVRNLAAKSAEAAKDTGGLISNSIEKAELGAKIAIETAASLTDIVKGINESSQLVTAIAKSSEEQSEGISQINKGIDQVAQVVQQNSATAEESAAASEEMSGQADVLENMVSQFKLLDTSRTGAKTAPLSGHIQMDMAQETQYDAGGYGKY